MELEIEKIQLARLRMLASSLQTSVWSRDYFPKEDRPDFNFLLEKLCIDDNPVAGPPLHPKMQQFEGSPEWRRLQQAGMAQSHEDFLAGEAKKIAQYNPYLRAISFSKRSLLLPDKYLQRFIAHEMATDIYGRAVVTPYQDLTAGMRKSVDDSTAQLRSHGIYMSEDLAVTKTGYMTHLLSGGLLVAQLSFPEAYIFDEIYPTVFEMISGELMKVGGSVKKFEADARKGRLQIDPNEQHPNFVRTLFESLQYVDWKDLLRAYRKSDDERTLRILGEATEHSQGIFVGLFDSMDRDEKNLESIVRGLAKGN